MLNYFNYKKQPEKEDKGKGKDKATTPDIQHEEPLLNEDDEAFFERIVSAPEGPAPPLPERPRTSEIKDAQTILMQGADKTPLPDVPDTPEGEVATGIEGEGGSSTTDKGNHPEKASKDRWSWLRRDSRQARRKEQAATAEGLHAAAQGLVAPANVTADGQITPNEVKKEEDEMASVLDQLNLAAVNNRVFSISDESKDLLKKFTLVLKDLVNGVPTAYHDLESLLTNSDRQIQKTYKSLPPFLQELIEKLPEKFTAHLGPEFLAAAAERQGLKSEYVSKGASAAEKVGLKLKVPSLKDLLTKSGSVATLLRTIMNALKARFPAFLGMNVLWSLALFILLFVFWYCHKRGKEERLEKERKVTEQEMQAIAARVAADPAWTPPPGWGERQEGGGEEMMTRAPNGASIEEVTMGMLPPAEEAGEEAYAPGGSLAKALKEEQERRERERANREEVEKDKEVLAGANGN